MSMTGATIPEMMFALNQAGHRASRGGPVTHNTVTRALRWIGQQPPVTSRPEKPTKSESRKSIRARAKRYEVFRTPEYAYTALFDYRPEWFTGRGFDPSAGDGRMIREVIRPSLRQRFSRRRIGGPFGLRSGHNQRLPHHGRPASVRLHADQSAIHQGYGIRPEGPNACVWRDLYPPINKMAGNSKAKRMAADCRTGLCAQPASTTAMGGRLWRRREEQRYGFRMVYFPARL